MVQTVSGSLTAAGLSTPLRLGNADQVISWSVAAGTYSGHVLYVERSKSSDLGPWDVIAGPFTTDDVALSGTYYAKAGDRFRFRVEDVLTGTDDVTGTIVHSMSGENYIVDEIFDADSNVVLRLNRDGVAVSGDQSVGGVLTVAGDVVGANVSATGAGAGASNGTGVSAVETGNGVLQKTVITLAAHQIPVLDANAFAASKLYDFPAGAIKVLGSTADLVFRVTSERASTINLNAALDWALGTSAEASDTTLDSVQANLIAKQDLTLDQADAGDHPDEAQNGTDVTVDGTTTPVDVNLNVAFPTTTDIDGDGTLEVDGTITIHWLNLGDY